MGMGIEVMGKWEWECSVELGMDGNGNDLGTRKSFPHTSTSDEK